MKLVPVRRMMQCGALALLIMLLAGSGQAKYIWVPADYPTIQAGIDAAVDGDTVLVSMGRYSGPGNRDIDFGGKKIFVDGAYPSLTIIDCGGTPAEHHGGFIFHSGETESSVLFGFTITNAYFGSLSDSGAIMLRGASPRISNCQIIDNHATGISVRPTFAFDTGPRIDSCSLSRNAGWGVSWPGYPSNLGGLQISSCIVSYNSLGGLEVPLPLTMVIVANNTIVENGGHGIVVLGDLPAEMRTAAYSDTNAYFQNNLIAYNKGFGVYGWCCSWSAMQFHFHCNDVFGNSLGDWNYPMTPGIDTVNNISLDPKLCSPESDNYGVQPTSPCLPSNNQCGVLIGAVGDNGCLYCGWVKCGNVDCDPGNGVDISDLSTLIDHLYISLQPLCCPEAANCDGIWPWDIADLTALIDNLFISQSPLGNCPL